MSKMKVLKRTQFGNPVLREWARPVNVDEITSKHVQELVANMRYTLVSKKLGVGLAAPQVGESLAIAVIAIHPTELRPNIEPFDAVFINPEMLRRLADARRCGKAV